MVSTLVDDMKISMLNLISKDFGKIGIDDSFGKQKKDDLKVIYRL